MQMGLPLPHELIVDNFAGGGGASTGIERAFGRPVDIAINHDSEALAMHRANHPQTLHLCESVFSVDPCAITRNQPVGLAWFSPDCTHHSKAKGGKPRSNKSRGLAWVVIRWARRVRPRVIMLENVEEFSQWGPLTADGQPCPARKGQTFREWIGQLERFGYHVEWRELRACDYGAPTIRKRLFLVARRDGLPIVWPKPTHGPHRIPYRTAAEIIDWSIPCPSIFERARPLADATCRRIAAGIMRFVVNSAEPFIMPVTHGGGFRGHPLQEPLRTVTCAYRGEFALVAPTMLVNTTGHPGSRADEPLRTVCTSGHHAVVASLLASFYSAKDGESRCNSLDDHIRTITTSPRFGLVSAFLAKHYTGVVGKDLEQPLGTVTTHDHHSYVTSHLVKLRGTCKDGQPVTEPLPTITAGGWHVGEVRAFLMKYYGTGGQWQPVNEPLHTVPTKDRFGLVMVHGEPHVIADIGMRMLQPHELAAGQGFPADYTLTPEVNGKPLTKTSQIRMIGNSVVPALAEALVRANFRHERRYAEVAA